MQRWHEDTALMLRRWGIEVDRHRHPSLGYIEFDCHRLRGKGTMRKRTPWTHHRRCYLCQWSKYFRYGRRGDGTRRRGRANWNHAAFSSEEEANG